MTEGRIGERMHPLAAVDAKRRSPAVARDVHFARMAGRARHVDDIVLDPFVEAACKPNWKLSWIRRRRRGIDDEIERAQVVGIGDAVTAERPLQVEEPAMPNVVQWRTLRCVVVGLALRRFARRPPALVEVPHVVHRFVRRDVSSGLAFVVTGAQQHARRDADQKKRRDLQQCASDAARRCLSAGRLSGESGHSSLSFEARVSTGLFGQAARPIDAADGLALGGGIGRHIDEMRVAFVSRQHGTGQHAKAANDMERRLLFLPFDARVFNPEARLAPAAPMRHPFGVEQLQPEIE